ncbi:Ldh family oxidoreductase [Eisenibacter elegans]|uniref:Ldh family oxidoreductase n=1 Tax=Eisenibacter elegans TaxID=997 RepID=UPI00041F1731|nr:Ldh family oxidoreductase [Eisenibacter elegans]
MTSNNTNPTQQYAADALQAFVEAVFSKIGCSDTDATKAARVLIAADLRGIDSHGVARLSGYVKQWEMGKLNTRPRMQIVHQTPSTATIDGDRGLGLLIGQYAMQVAIDKAGQVGSGWVAVRNSGHYGIAGYHAMLALAHDMIGISTTHASALAVPTFGIEKMLGTNPLAVAIPAGQKPPLVADFATTAAAYGKLQILQRKGQEAPIGWAQDAQGAPTTNPHAPKEGGALLTLGSDELRSSHKGYCMSAVVDILSGVLPGANYGPWVPPFATAGSTSERQPPVGKGTGHFFGALRIDGFQPAEVFKSHIDNWIDAFEQTKAIEGKRVLIPGEPERLAEAERLEKGIPILAPVVADLESLGQKLGIEWIQAI